MIEIIELMDSLFQQHRSIDIAESEFMRLIYDDELLHHEYKAWCRSHGFTERKGFAEFCQSRIEEEESRWEVLDDPDID